MVDSGWQVDTMDIVDRSSLSTADSSIRLMVDTGNKDVPNRLYNDKPDII